MAQDGEGRPGVKAKILPGNPTDDVHVLSYTLQRNGSDWQAIDVGMGGFVSFAAVKQTELRAVLWSKAALALRNRPQELATELADKPAPGTSGKIRRSISARTSYPPAAATAMCRGRWHPSGHERSRDPEYDEDSVTAISRAANYIG